MTARLFDGQSHIHIAFFASCDKSEQLVLAYHLAVDNRAALVNDVFEADILFFEPVANMRRAFFRPRFFVVTEAEIHVALGLPTFRQKFLCGFQKGNHRSLHILRSAPPNESVVYCSAERLVIPALFGCGYDVLVCQKCAGKQSRILARKLEHEAVLVDDGLLRRLMYERISLFEPRVVIQKRLVYSLEFADHRHGGNLNGFGKVSCNKVLVEISRLILARVDFFGLAQERADYHRCQKHNDFPLNLDTEIIVLFLTFASYICLFGNIMRYLLIGKSKTYPLLQAFFVHHALIDILTRIN